MSKLSYLGERSEPRENKWSEPCENEQVSGEAVRGWRKELSFLSPPLAFASPLMCLSVVYFSLWVVMYDKEYKTKGSKI